MKTRTIDQRFAKSEIQNSKPERRLKPETGPAGFEWSGVSFGLRPSIFLAVLFVLFLGLSAFAGDAQSTGTAADQVSSYRTIGLSIAAAVSVGASILGAGYAVGRIGSAAIGAIAEKPELLPRAMLFVALGEGLAVLGFAFAIWLLLRM